MCLKLTPKTAPICSRYASKGKLVPSPVCNHHSALQNLLGRDLLQLLIILMIAMLHLKAAVLSREMAGLVERH